MNNLSEIKTKISVNTLPKAVSKVSKGQEFDTKQAFDTFDTALGRVFTDCRFYSPKNKPRALTLADL